MFRLHIDVAAGHDEQEAVTLVVQPLLKIIQEGLKNHPEVIDNIEGKMGKPVIKYRLGNDEDRQRSNYLDKDANGHVSTKKFQLMI